MVNFDELQDNPDLLNALESDRACRPTKKAASSKDGDLEFLGYDSEGLAVFKGDFGL